MKPLSGANTQSEGENTQVVVAGLDREIAQLLGIINSLTRETKYENIFGEFLSVKVKISRMFKMFII